MTTWMLLALLHLFTYRSPVQAEWDTGELVRAVYAAGGLDAVAVVSMESQFNPRAERGEPRGHTSYGLFQLDDEWHLQHRGNLSAHIAEGARFLEECKDMRVAEAALTGPSGRYPSTRSFSSAIAIYNGGMRPGRQARAWGKKVEARRDSLALWLWRHLK